MAGLSSFPGNIDEFTRHFEISAAEVPYVQRFQELKLKANRTPLEETEMSQLATRLRPNFISSEDFNKFQDALVSMQVFIRDNVVGYIDTMKTQVDVAKDNALIAIETKKNGVIEYLDGTEAGKMRNDIGVMADLQTSAKASLVKAINEVNAKAPLDASTTQKGVVKLSNATNSTSESESATPKAVKEVYDLANSKETTTGAQAKADAVKTYVNNLTWQKSKMTADGGTAINLAIGTDLHTHAFSTGFYMGSGIINAPSTGWYYFEVMKHNDAFMTINAYNLDATINTFYQKKKINGTWGSWSADLFQSVSNGKADLEYAITQNKGGTVSKAGSIATFPELVNGVNSIQQGRYGRQTITLNSGSQVSVEIPSSHSGPIGPTLATFAAGTRVIGITGHGYSDANGTSSFSAYTNKDNSLWVQLCFYDNAGKQWNLMSQGSSNQIVNSDTLYVMGITIDLVAGVSQLNCGKYGATFNTATNKFTSSMPSGFNVNGPMTLRYAVTSALNATGMYMNLALNNITYLSM